MVEIFDVSTLHPLSVTVPAPLTRAVGRSVIPAPTINVAEAMDMAESEVTFAAPGELIVRIVAAV